MQTEGGLNTIVKKNVFIITIEYESDISLDGGYTFENISNYEELELGSAIQLRDELTNFINSF